MLADHPVLHHAIAFGLWYVLIGASTWTWLYCSETWNDVKEARVRKGISFDWIDFFLASLAVILTWPLLVWTFTRAVFLLARRPR